MPKDLSVFWQFTSIENIRAKAREQAHRLDVDPETVNALWIKAGGTHVIMTTHPPEEPKPKYGAKWWTFSKARVVWFYWFYHEYSHAIRDSAEHPEA